MLVSRTNKSWFDWCPQRCRRQSQQLAFPGNWWEVPDNGVIQISKLRKLTSADSESKLTYRRDWQPHALCSSASRPRERVETTSHRRSCGAQTSCCVAEHLKSGLVADLSGIGTHMPFKPIDTFSRSGYAQAPCLLQLLTPNSSPSSPLRHRQMSTKAVRLQPGLTAHTWALTDTLVTVAIFAGTQRP